MADRDGSTASAPQSAPAAAPPLPAAAVAPASAPGPAAESGAAGVSGLSQFVLVHKHGQVWIKFSCPCGQRLLFPTHHSHPVGRCGRCGREHRLVGMEKRIANFEKHLAAAKLAHAQHHPADAPADDESLVTRLLKPSEYAPFAGPDERPPEPDSFQAFFQGLVGDRSQSAADTGAIPPQRSGAAPAAAADTGAIAFSSAETVELPPPPPSVKLPSGPGAAATLKAAAGAAGRAGPDETSTLTDYDLAPFEPHNSARVRETADQAADRLRPRPSQLNAPSQAGGLIWAWPPATAFQRLLATSVDLLLPALGAVAAAFIARLADAGAGSRLMWAWATLTGLGLLVDLAGPLLFGGASPGKRLSGIHVRQQNGQLPGFLAATLRSLVKWGLTPILWPLARLDPDHRCLHDRLCHTRVMFGRPR